MYGERSGGGTDIKTGGKTKRKREREREREGGDEWQRRQEQESYAEYLNPTLRVR